MTSDPNIAPSIVQAIPADAPAPDQPRALRAPQDTLLNLALFLLLLPFIIALIFNERHGLVQPVRDWLAGTNLLWHLPALITLGLHLAVLHLYIAS